MKLTKKYLKKIIKEELENSIGELSAESEGPGEDFYKFVKILVDGGMKNSQIHDAVQATEYAEEASSEDVEAAIAKAQTAATGD